MSYLRAIFAVVLLGPIPAMAIDPTALAAAGQYKAGKVVSVADVGIFMQRGERWCYNEAGGACDWSEVYLAVDGESARYETSGRWDAEIEVINLGLGLFSDDGRLCDTNAPIFDSLRARRSTDGTDIGGRELDAIRTEWMASSAENADQEPLCYDYQFGGLDTEAETISLTQRVWRDGTHDAAEDDLVTIHFSAETAGALTVAP